MNDLYPWHQAQWQLLTSRIKQQRLPHALLLAGQKGLGQLQFAKQFIQYLFCNQRRKDLEPCGECRDCRLLMAGNHPDFINIFPEEKSKVIKIEQIRDLILITQQTAQRNGYKIILLQPAEMLNRAAANCLLKLLEEPIGNMLFLLVCHQLDCIPSTIRSRCQYIHFKTSEDQQTMEWVASQLKQSSNAPLLMKMAENAPLEALELSENNYLQLRDQMLQYLLKIDLPNNDPIEQLDEFLKYNIESVLKVLTTIILDMIRLQLGARLCYIVNSDQISQLQTLCQKRSPWFLQQLLTKLQKAQEVVRSGVHINLQLMLEGLLLEWIQDTN